MLVAVPALSPLWPICETPRHSRSAVDLSSRVLITEIYASALAHDEYVSIRSFSDVDVPLSGWTITDGEGAVMFLQGAVLEAKANLSISFNSTSYASSYGHPPSIGLDDPSSPAVAVTVGDFRMADARDEIILCDAVGTCVDAVVYGDPGTICPWWSGDPVPAPRAGEVLRRIMSGEEAVDTDGASDWTQFREFRYGSTDFRPFRAEVATGCIEAFVSPDCSLGVLRHRLDAALTDIRVCSYEFSSPELTRSLVDALNRGVSVRVLVDGSPVGGMSSSEMVALSMLQASGARVLTVSGRLDEGVVRHISALHSKYLVIDRRVTVVMSENMVPSGVPADPLYGNRGWGVVIEDEPVAEYLSSVFDEDSRVSRRDILAWDNDPRFDPSAECLPEEAVASREGQIAPFVASEGATVAMYVSPDSSANGPFLSELVSGFGRLSVEQFQADLLWTTRWEETETLNPLVGQVLEGMRAGGTARMLLDSSWFNEERNGALVDSMTAVSRVDSLEGDFRLLDEDSPVTVLHNKGLVVDDDLTVVSSNNWVYASFARNRELAVAVYSQEVAGYFLSAFESDWVPDRTSPDIELPDSINVTVGERVRLSSSGCVDDRVVARVSWDMQSDGTVDSTESEFSFVALEPGTVSVTLTAVDAWGNSASSTVLVVIVVPGDPGLAAHGSTLDGMLWVAPAFAGALLIVRMLRRSRRPPPG